jgi:predicted DNA-binding transcriptional regulator YafY
VRYESWNAVVERRLEPLGLVLKAGVWYLVAKAIGGSATRSALRTYRVSGILALTLTDESFQRPPEFELAGWWQESTRRFETELYRESAVLRVSPRGMKSLRHLDAVQADAAEASAGRPDKSGWRRVTIPIESIPNAAAQLMRLGGEVRVLQPAELRRQLLARVDAIAAVYRRPRRVAPAP